MGDLAENRRLLRELHEERDKELQEEVFESILFAIDLTREGKTASEISRKTGLKGAHVSKIMDAFFSISENAMAEQFSRGIAILDEEARRKRAEKLYAGIYFHYINESGMELFDSMRKGINGRVFEVFPLYRNGKTVQEIMEETRFEKSLVQEIVQEIQEAPEEEVSTQGIATRLILKAAKQFTRTRHQDIIRRLREINYEPEKDIRYFFRFYTDEEYQELTKEL